MIDRLDAFVGRELERLGAGGAAGDVVAAWPDLVGATVARHAWPARLGRDRTLHVATSSSTWTFELTQLAPAILEKLRMRLGDAAPTALRFAPGPLPEPPAERLGTPAAAARPDPDDWALAEEAVSCLDNDELRLLLRKAVAFSLAKRRS